MAATKNSTAPAPSIFDSHTHTQFAYCGEDVIASAVISRSRERGLVGVAITEHAPQLYCSREDFWGAKHLFDPKLWRSKENSRMSEYRQAVFPLRDEFVFVGFEVEVDSCGDLTILDEDRESLDLLLGAVHWLNCDTSGMTPAQEAAAFLKTSQQLLTAGVDVLAHPWRYFGRANLPVPKELYPELVEMLAATKTAAEINYHTNQPDSDFFAMCIDSGVKISLGSDSHAMWEVGEFDNHIKTLNQAARGKDVSNLIYTPQQKSF